MQTIPYPVYYVLVVNDGEILAGHYCVLLYTSQPNARESETVALDLKAKIESAFQDLFFKKNNRWIGIELVDCSVMSDEALTYAQSVIFKQWRLEHLSLREEEEQPMMDQ
jgi:hypothetical protein